MDKPLLSVIIPVYKCESYLVRAINSVLLQPRSDLLEIILIDDGSPDKSGQICDQFAKEYSEQITVIHWENKGTAAARNYGITLAKGYWLAFVDSDDWWEENFFTDTMYQELIESTSFDLVEFAYRRVSNDYKYKKSFPVVAGELIEKDPNRIFDEGAHWKYFYRRQFILEQNIRYFPVRTGQDRPFVDLSIQFASSIKTVNCFLYNYYYNMGSAVHSGFSEDTLANRIKVIDLKGKILEAHGIPYDTHRIELSTIAELLPKLCIHYPYKKVVSILSNSMYDDLRDVSIQPWSSLQPIITLWRNNSKWYWLKTRIWPGKKNVMEKLYFKYSHFCKFLDIVRFKYYDHWDKLSENEYKAMMLWLERCNNL